MAELEDDFCSISTTTASLPEQQISIAKSSPDPMHTSDNCYQIIKWILKHISFHALRILLELENQFPIIPTALSSSDRLDFFTDVINIACGTSYTKSNMCAIHNIIIMNDCIKKELITKVDINEYVTRYKTSKQIVGSLYTGTNLISIMPFTNVCTNENCQQQNLHIELSRTGYVVYLASIEPCSIFVGICKCCKCTYGPSSILDTHINRRIITVQAIENMNYVYFSGELVYSRELLTMFSNSLIHAHITFEGFAESYISTLRDLHRHPLPICSVNAFAKRLEVVWIYYELSRFIFVTSCETSIIFPRSFQPETRSVFIEQNLPFFLHIFTVFWSHHQMIDGIKCKQSSCSRVMLIDGHQKSRRVVCQFRNVTNINHPEMGPVVQGCPYAPTRKKRNGKRKDQSAYYCQHHGKYIEELGGDEQFHSSEYEEANEIDQRTIGELDNDEMCNVYRNDIGENQKNRSFGLLVTFLSCNVVIGFVESIKSEGCRRVTDHLLTLLKAGARLSDALIYDNACALRLHWNKVYGTNYMKKNEMTEKLHNLLLVLDRFHQKGHVRPMCRKMMNPDDSQHEGIFKNINTSVCEQFFSFLTKFRSSLRGFNYPTSTLFTLLLFHLKNSHTTGIKTNAFGLGRLYFSDKIRPHFVSPCVFESVNSDIIKNREITRKDYEEKTRGEKTGEEIFVQENDEDEHDEEEVTEEETSEESLVEENDEYEHGKEEYYGELRANDHDEEFNEMKFHDTTNKK